MENFSLFYSSEEDALLSYADIRNFQIFTWKFDDVVFPLTISLWILFTLICRGVISGSHVTKWVPESAVLILLGLLVAFLLKTIGIPVLALDPHVFFLYLLPPIIFDAGYFLPSAVFFKNFDSIMIFAVIGTLWCFFSVGTTIWLLSGYFSFSLSITEIFLFASLISAVDPVAVIAVFEELHVNDFLFVTVFGEALYNDAVAIVLYQLCLSLVTLPQELITGTAIALKGVSFLVLLLGGAFVGVVFAFLTSIVSRGTKSAPLVGIGLTFMIPYLGYLVAEMTSVSSLIAIAVCGTAVKPYVSANLGDFSESLGHMIKVVGQNAEAISFLFLGVTTLLVEQHFDIYFIVITIAGITVYRAIGVIIQCFLLEKIRGKKFTKTEQFMFCYGGLRGAIAYALVLGIPDSISAKPLFVTTTTAVVFFTVFVQGITIRPWLDYLKVARKQKDSEGESYSPALWERLNRGIIRPILVGSARVEPEPEQIAL